jgi:hypothetical protein
MFNIISSLKVKNYFVMHHLEECELFVIVSPHHGDEIHYDVIRSRRETTRFERKDTLKL